MIEAQEHELCASYTVLDHLVQCIDGTDIIIHSTAGQAEHLRHMFRVLGGDLMADLNTNKNTRGTSTET
jgi:hypothetical protein